MMRLLLLLEVARGGARFDRPLAVDLARSKKQSFGQGGFPTRARASQKDVMDVGRGVSGHELEPIVPSKTVP
jgi:hypothetical protein